MFNERLRRKPHKKNKWTKKNNRRMRTKPKRACSANNLERYGFDDEHAQKKQQQQQKHT